MSDDVLEERCEAAWRVEVSAFVSFAPSVGWLRRTQSDRTFRTIAAARRYARDWTGCRTILAPHVLYRSEIKETTRPRDVIDRLLSLFHRRPPALKDQV